MNYYLLDTHIFIWAYAQPNKLNKELTRILQNSRSVKYLSAISLVEIALLLETKPKELNIQVPLSTWISQALSELQVQLLTFTPEHAQRFYEIQLMKNHKDQFDRTIIAQGASTGFAVISDDENFPYYPIEVISNKK